MLSPAITGAFVTGPVRGKTPDGVAGVGAGGVAVCVGAAEVDDSALHGDGPPDGALHLFHPDLRGPSWR